MQRLRNGLKNFTLLAFVASFVWLKMYPEDRVRWGEMVLGTRKSVVTVLRETLRRGYEMLG